MDDGIFRDACWSAECDCGWVKSIPLTRESNAESLIRSKANKHMKNVVKYQGPHTDRDRMRWHERHPEASVRTFRAVRIRCRFCDYTSDPCETMDEVGDCLDEHTHTQTHTEYVEQRQLAAAVAKAVR